MEAGQNGLLCPVEVCVTQLKAAGTPIIKQSRPLLHLTEQGRNSTHFFPRAVLFKG